LKPGPQYGVADGLGDLTDQIIIDVPKIGADMTLSALKATEQVS
jgi:hypothetical protein